MADQEVDDDQAAVGLELAGMETLQDLRNAHELFVSWVVIRSEP